MGEYLVTRNFYQETTGTKTNCIREATALAEDGDIIVLDFGEWDEKVSIDKAVTFRGRGAREETTVRGTIDIKASNVTIRDLTIMSHGQDKLEEVSQPAGLTAENVDDLVVADCIILEWRPGVSLKSVKNARIAGCLFERNQQTGVMLRECENCEVIGNEFNANSWFAVRLVQSSGNRIDGNRIELTGWASIDMFTKSRNNVVTGNIIYGGNLGISVASANNVIEKNRIEQCNHAIFVGDVPFDCVPVEKPHRKHLDTDIRGNVVRHNDIRDPKREGVLMRRASGTVVEGNVITRAQCNGVVVISDESQKIGKNSCPDSPLAEAADLTSGYKLDHEPDEVLWGDTHMHTETSDASGSIAEGLAYGRDVLGLDFVASADHSEHMVADKQNDRWAHVRETCKEFNEPGRFIAIPGFELTYPNTWWSHLNVYYADFDGPVFSGADIVNMKLIPEASPPEHMLELLKGVKSRHLIIRHHYWSCPFYWDRTVHDTSVIPATDICSIHAIWEKDGDIFRNAPWGHPISTVRQGLSRGLRFAVMAGSDTHYGLPGDYALTAVLTDDLTADGIFDAIVARRTYATTGEKIGIEFTVDGHQIGSSYVPEKPPVIRAKVNGTAELETVQIIRDNCVVLSRPGGTFTAEIEFEDPDWQDASFYYLRVVQRDGGCGWTTPVWLDRT